MTAAPLKLILLGISCEEAMAPAFMRNAAQTDRLDECLRMAGSMPSCDAVMIGLDIADTLPVHAVRRLAEAFPDIALIVCASSRQELTALTLVDAGATDYVLHDVMDDDNQISRIDYAIQRQAARSIFRISFEARGCKPERPWDWAFELGPDLKFRWFSGKFEARQHVSASVLLGRKPWEVDEVDHDPERWRQYIKDFTERKPFSSLACRLRDHQGGRLTFRIWGDPVFAPDGGFLGYVGTGVDISAEVENTTRLNDAYELLKDMFDDLQSYREKVEEDMDVARRSQRELLPKPELLATVEEQCNVRLSYFFEPTMELGGDIWGLVPLSAELFALYLADFSGHGVAAALNTFRLTTLIQEHHEQREEPAAYLEILNSRLKENLPTGQYATMLYGIVDQAAGVFRYAAAAAPRPLVIDLKTGGVVPGDGRGLPLGAVSGAKYQERELKIGPGSMIVLASDALAESADMDGVPLGKDGVAELLRAAALEKGEASNAWTLLDPFFKKVERPLKDDLTLVSCQILASF